MEHQALLWKSFDSKQHRSAENVIFNEVRPADVCGFIRGVGAIYAAVIDKKPDVVFFPLRGAEPIDAVMEIYEAYDGIQLDRSYFPIGTFTDVKTNRQGGYKTQKKTEIIQQELDRLFDRSEGGQAIRRVTFIDEVQSGRTSSTAVQVLRSLLPESVELSFVAAQDVRDQVKTREKVKGFVRLITNTNEDIRTSSIPLPLFYIDRTGLLSTILQPTSDHGEIIPDHLMLHVLHNREFRKLIQNLTLISIQPSLLGDVLENFSNIDSNYYLGKEENREFYQWLGGVFESLGTNSWEKGKVFSWMKNFHKECLERDP